VNLGHRDRSKGKAYSEFVTRRRRPERLLICEAASPAGTTGEGRSATRQKANLVVEPELSEHCGNRGSIGTGDS
jgi:hypothetical protein